MTDTHETDQLIAVLTDALEIYGRPDAELPQRLAAVIRREHSVIPLTRSEKHPIRLWDGNLQYVAGDSPIEVTRNGDDRTVLVAVDSPISLALLGQGVDPASDLHLTIEGDTPLTRWAGHVYQATKVEGGISISAISYVNELGTLIGGSMKDAG